MLLNGITGYLQKIPLDQGRLSPQGSHDLPEKNNRRSYVVHLQTIQSHYSKPLFCIRVGGTHMEIYLLVDLREVCNRSTRVLSSNGCKILQCGVCPAQGVPRKPEFSIPLLILLSTHGFLSYLLSTTPETVSQPFIEHSHCWVCWFLAPFSVFPLEILLHSASLRRTDSAFTHSLFLFLIVGRAILDGTCNLYVRSRGNEDGSELVINSDAEQPGRMSVIDKHGACMDEIRTGIPGSPEGPVPPISPGTPYQRTENEKWRVRSIKSVFTFAKVCHPVRWGTDPQASCQIQVSKAEEMLWWSCQQVATQDNLWWQRVSITE